MNVDKKFLKKVKKGNKVAEKKLFDYTKSKIKEFIDKKYNTESSEDDTSDIVIKIFEKIDKFDNDKSKYSTWIINVAKNHMIDKSRLYCNNVFFYTTSTNSTTLDSLDITCSNTGENKTITFTSNNSFVSDFENKDEIKELTHTMDSSDMSMLRMKYSSGYNYEEIATELNMDKKQVSNRVNYIKKKIKKGG